MSKISTYSLADTPLSLSDRLIGTEAFRTTPTPTPLATKNFSLGELLQLFSANFPAASLQAVLNTGNTATQNITLTGTITTTVIKPNNIEDTSGSQGTTFQYLSKGTSSINWVNLPIDTLQAVLNAGNIATQNITLVGNITSTRIIPGNIQDDTGGIGIIGQVLSKTATGIRWITNPSSFTAGLADVLSVGNTATNDITLIGDINASNAKITGAFYDSNNSPGTLGQVLSSKGTQTDWIDIPLPTPAALTEVDDINVTLTLGGSPNTALLQAVSLTLGWTGTLADDRIASAANWNAKFNLPSLTSGSVLFSNGTTIAQDNANLFWDDTNNRLGIGTTTPGASLDILATSLNVLRLGRTGYDTFTFRSSIGTGLELYNTTDLRSEMFFDGAGNIGIGTTSPGARLQINAQGALSTDIAFKVRNSANTADLFNVNGLGNVGIGVGTPAGKLDLFDSASSSLYVRTGSVGANWITGTALSQLGTYTDHPLVFKTNDTARMRIVNTTGNVLINTTTDIPSSKLTVESTTQGFLPPRMTTAQRNAIASPATGLIIYDTTLLSEFQYNGTSWVTYQSQLNGTGFVKASGTTISYDNSNYKKNVVSAVGNFVNPQNLTQNIIRSYLIPANSFLINDTMNLSIAFDKYNSNGTATVRAYINSTVTLTGAQLIMTFTSATTSRFIVLKRMFSVALQDTITGLLSTSSAITDSIASTITSEGMTYASNQDRFLIITIQQTNVNDTVYTSTINLTN
jgi:hypothetical protein